MENVQRKSLENLKSDLLTCLHEIGIDIEKFSHFLKQCIETEKRELKTLLNEDEIIERQIRLIEAHLLLRLLKN